MLLKQVALVYFVLFEACFLLAFVKNRIKSGIKACFFIVVLVVWSSLPVYLLWFVFIPALSRIE